MSSRRIPSISIFDIKAFIATAESSGQAEAAKKLKCTQPTISRAITNLETLSGLVLTNADYPRKLTTQGEGFLPIAKQMIELLENAKRDLKRRTTMQSPPISGRDIKIDPKLLFPK